MTWADALPNFLIGLREGLEAGLVVSILLAAVRKAGADTLDPDSQAAQPRSIWLGVLGAVLVAGSFAAVLTFSTNALSSSAQEAVGGLLSVLAVGLVTGMVFWMRRTARTLSKQLRGEVIRAISIGAGALTLTAFLAVGREGLETTLFLWTAVKASGSTLAPLIGAGFGLAAAVVLCWLLYERAIRIDVGQFFSRTALALIVIAAGVLAYGLGDLQDAGWLPGGRWVAFDLTAHVNPNAWWMSVLTGVTDLAPRMTVLQTVAWLVYLAVVIPTFLAAGRVKRYTDEPSPKSLTLSPEPTPSTTDGRWEKLAGGRPKTVAGVLVVAPALVAGLIIAALPSAGAAKSAAVTVTKTTCAPQWSTGHTGAQTFAVTNKSGVAGEINLDDSAGAVAAEIETIGPATTASMSATLGAGTYTFTCLMAGRTIRGNPVQVTGEAQATTTPVKPVTVADLAGPNHRYQVYAASQLTALKQTTVRLRADIVSADLVAAKQDWLAAQLDWERVGASYDSFGDEGLAVDGLPDGYPGGVTDSGFTGLHRIEYGLYHGQDHAQLLPVVDRLQADITTVQKKLATDDEAGDPTNLPLRVHEVLEDALRDHLSGIDDQGSAMAYAETYADTQVTIVLLDDVGELITARLPSLRPTITAQLSRLQTSLLATRIDGHWQPIDAVPANRKQTVDADLGAVLESLSIEPDLLEVPPSR